MFHPLPGYCGRIYRHLLHRTDGEVRARPGQCHTDGPLLPVPLQPLPGQQGGVRVQRHEPRGGHRLPV